jgi:hypothetical protein
MKYRKVIIAVCIIALCALTLYFCADNIVVAVTKRQLKNICTGSIVSIGRCTIKPARSVALADIEIKVPAVYDIKIKDLKISYSISSLVKGEVLKFYLGDSSFYVNMGGKDITRLKRYFNLGSGKRALKVNEAKISGLALMLKARDVKLSGKISLALDLGERHIKNIDLKLDSLDTQGALLESGYIIGKPEAEGAKVYVKSVKYNDVKIDDIAGSVLVKDNVVFLKAFSAKGFGGTVSGDMSYRMDKDRDFAVDLNAVGLDLATFVREMKMEKKFQMAGGLSGKVALAGNGLAPIRVNGDFSTDAKGGVLVIKDTSFLENMAKNSGQSLDVLMESFKQYQYDIGLMRLSADADNLMLDIILEGSSGKRNFNVVLHGFLSKKGWRI